MRLFCRGNPPMEQLWTGCRFAKANENLALVGLFLSGNRLNRIFSIDCAAYSIGIRIG